MACKFTSFRAFDFCHITVGARSGNATIHATRRKTYQSDETTPKRNGFLKLNPTFRPSFPIAWVLRGFCVGLAWECGS